MSLAETVSRFLNATNFGNCMDYMAKSQPLALETSVTYTPTGYMLFLFVCGVFLIYNDLNKVSIIQIKIYFNHTIKSFQNMPAKLKLSELKRIKNSEVR